MVVSNESLQCNLLILTNIFGESCIIETVKNIQRKNVTYMLVIWQMVLFWKVQSHVTFLTMSSSKILSLLKPPSSMQERSVTFQFTFFSLSDIACRDFTATYTNINCSSYTTTCISSVNSTKFCLNRLKNVPRGP